MSFKKNDLCLDMYNNVVLVLEDEIELYYDDEVSNDELLYIENITSVFKFDQDKVDRVKDEALGIDGSFKVVRSASAWDMI